MQAMTKLTTIETRVFLRERASIFWGLVFPALLLGLLGAVFPGFLDATADLDGDRPIDIYAPVVLALGLATLGVMSLPVILTTYRQTGVLRRMSTTPVPPSRLLAAQLVLHLGVAVVAATLAIVVGAIAFDVPVPGNPLGFGVSFLLAAGSLFALGLLVAAVARTTSSAQGIGMALYFPLLLFSGVYLPRVAMPDGLRTASDLTPAGAAVQALQDTWGGAAPSASNLLVMAVYAVVAGLLAAKLFRWE